MDVAEALPVIRCLANGVDPCTGEVLSPDNPCQHPMVIRALFVATQALERAERSLKRERALPEHAGKAWDAAEDSLLCVSFDGGATVRTLSQRHGRTLGAIQSRLEKLQADPAPVVAGTL